MDKPDEIREEEAAVRKAAWDTLARDFLNQQAGCGCMIGFVLAFVAIYMGWCSPYPLGH